MQYGAVIIYQPSGLVRTYFLEAAVLSFSREIDPTGMVVMLAFLKLSSYPVIGVLQALPLLP